MKSRIYQMMSVIFALAILGSFLIAPTPVFANGSPIVVSTIKVGEAGGAYAFAVNPNTNLIYAVGGSIVSVIDGLTNRILATVNIGNEAECIAVNPATNRVYAGNVVIDGFNNSVIAKVGLGGPKGVAVNPNSNRIYEANSSNNTISVIDGSNNSLLTTVNVGNNPVGIAVNINTNLIYTANAFSGNVSVVDGTNNSLVATVNLGGDPGHIAVNPNTNLIYVADFSGNVSVINGFTNSVEETMIVGSNPSGIAVNPSTNYIYITDWGQHIVSVINGSTNTIVVNVNVGSLPSGIAVNPTTGFIYVSGSYVSVIDGSTNKVTTELNLGSGPTGIAVNPNTNRVYVANSLSNNVSVIDGLTNSVLATVNTGSRPRDIAVNPITNLIYVANYSSNNISVIDGYSNSVFATVNVGIVPVGVAVNTITNLIYVANEGNNTVSVIDGSSNQVVATVNGVYTDFNGASVIAVNPTTNRIYAGNKVIDGSSNTVIAEIATTGEGIAVNPNTNLIYTTINLASSSVLVVNGSTNAIVATINVGSNAWGIAVNPNTNRIYVANNASNHKVTIIDGSSNIVVSTVDVGRYPWDVAINPTTNLIYVTNELSDTVSVIQDNITTRTPSAINLVSSINPSMYGQSVTFTAKVSSQPSGTSTPSGTIQFMDNGINVGAPVTLNSAGVATYTPSVLLSGIHDVSAIYIGDNVFAACSGTLTGKQTVNVIATKSILTASANPSLYSQSVTFTAKVIALSATEIPFGMITFNDGNTFLGVKEIDSAGVASFTTTALEVGDHVITAVYNGYINFYSSTDSLTETVRTQGWYLDSIGNPIMEKTGSQRGSVPVENGATVTWLSNQKSDTPVIFNSGDWKVYLNTKDLTGNYSIQIGESDGTSHGFTAFTVAVNGTDNGQPLSLTFNTGGTVAKGHYLALQVTNTGTGSVITDGSSYLTAPSSTPTYPVPEMSAGFLLGLGLAGIGGFVFLRRKKIVCNNIGL